MNSLQQTQKKCIFAKKLQPMVTIKHIILTSLLLFTCGGMPTFATTIADENAITENLQITINVNGSNVRISNASGKILEIYNITGVKIASYKIDSSDKTISLGHLSKSCYILKIGNIVRKISIL